MSRGANVLRRAGRARASCRPSRPVCSAGRASPPRTASHGDGAGRAAPGTGRACRCRRRGVPGVARPAGRVRRRRPGPRGTGRAAGQQDQPVQPHDRHAATEAEVAELVSSDDHRVYAISVTTASVATASSASSIVDATDPDAWELDTFLMSCRVLRRGVESASCWPRRRRRRAGEPRSRAVGYRATAKNGQVETFYSGPRLRRRSVRGGSCSISTLPPGRRRTSTGPRDA